MSVRIGLLSDVHAMPGPVEEALGIFAREGVGLILCGGDIAGYGDELDRTVALLRRSDCRGVRGNHDQWALERAESAESVAVLHYLCALPLARSFIFEGVFVYLVHASPPLETMGGIRLLDEDGGLISAQLAQWRERLSGFGHDVLVVGHTHQIYAEQLGDTLVINPGSTLFNHSCAVLTLPERRLRWFGLSGCDPVSTWNWGAGPMDSFPGNC